MQKRVGHRWLIRLGTYYVRDCMVEASLRDWENVSCGLMVVAIWQNRPPSSTMFVLLRLVSLHVELGVKDGMELEQ